MQTSLAHRLLHWIAQTSSRTDVTVQRQTPSWGGSLGVWKKALPADMFEFYDALNCVSNEERSCLSQRP